MFILSFVRFLKKLFYSIYTNQVAQNFKNFSLGLVFLSMPWQNRVQNRISQNVRNFKVF